jgi:hypothetical protein
MGADENPSGSMPHAGDVPGYVRPVLPTSTHYSPDGEPIQYGQRWGEDGPPSDTYSVLSHPERFAGLHDVALARSWSVCAARMRSCGWITSSWERPQPSSPPSSRIGML